MLIIYKIKYYNVKMSITCIEEVSVGFEGVGMASKLPAGDPGVESGVGKEDESS